MSLSVVGQRCVSEREPELGLGVVESVDRTRIGIHFPATGERRLYAAGTPVLKRVQFRAGENLGGRKGAPLVVESVTEAGGLLTYHGGGRSLREDEISDITSVSLPNERLMAGQADPGEVFDLRLRSLRMQARIRQSEVRGYVGGRLDLIPHQFYILHEVAARPFPRVLLADEVGLGKTIEACLILQRLLAVGKARRVLILVPESLTHQWFVELLRRFDLWFSIYDEARCSALEESDPGANPFEASQWALAGVGFLAGSPTRREQAEATSWDLVIVDEAHHLRWSPEEASPEYQLVETLARRSPGLLLLTATPTQLGLPGHFARLRLLDPARYPDLARFIEESERFGPVAAIAEKIVDQKPLKPKDHAALKRLFTRAPERLAEHLAALDAGAPGAREALLKTLLDQYGPGRVIFRNTRAQMTGFPKRRAVLVPLAVDNLTLLARIARELQAEESGQESGLRYSFKEDPRIDWLVGLLQEVRPAKVLVICRSQRKVMAIEAALKEKTNLNLGVFHEGLPLVQRDRQAAWFAEPEGAQVLLASEIGSEGRNFQFAHHLVLFDLPLNPGLVEQRIGRLDRIGQTQSIRIHVPHIVGGADHCLARWYHEGLDALQRPLLSGNDYQERFGTRLLELALAYGGGHPERHAAAVDALIAETRAYRDEQEERLRKSRDRLLELNSFRPAIAHEVLERVRAVESDTQLRPFLNDLLDHFGVRIKEDENGDIFLDPSHAYVEAFPSIPADGMLATFQRPRALAREDIRFLSPDHALVQNAIDLLIDSPAGTTAFSLVVARKPNLLVEAVFVLEAVSDPRWHVDQFLAPTPIRVLLDIRGQDVSDQRSAEELARECEDGPLPRFLERPGFTAALLKDLLDRATTAAGVRARTLQQSAVASAEKNLGEQRQRLADLQRLNDHVHPEEVSALQERLDTTRAAIAAARLRLDSLRLVLEGPDVLETFDQ